MLSENLQIYRDCYELAKALMTGESQVPKQLRYGEYGRAVSMSLDALDMVYVANSDIMERPAALTRMLQLLGGVRSRVRLMGELRHLSVRRTAYLMTLIDRVSRQATGWRNATSQGQSRGATATREYRSPEKR